MAVRECVGMLDDLFKPVRDLSSVKVQRLDVARDFHGLIFAHIDAKAGRQCPEAVPEPPQPEVQSVHATAERGCGSSGLGLAGALRPSRNGNRSTGSGGASRSKGSSGRRPRPRSRRWS